MRKRTLIIAVASLLLTAILIGIYYISQSPAGMTIDPPYVIRTDSALTATLHVQTESPERVLATVTVTNHTQHDIWLYKPLLCDEEYSEEVFYVMTLERHNLKYRGQHNEQYIGGEPGPLPMVLPRQGLELYVKLAPNASHSTTTNLSKLFDFQHNRGRFMAVYGAYMPVIEEGKHVYERDTLSRSTARLVPAYYDVDSGFGKKRDSIYVQFEVK